MEIHQKSLVSLGKKFGLKDFVETGTNFVDNGQMGGTFLAVQKYFDRAFTIDLVEKLSPALTNLFVDSDRVFLFCGSSGDRLGPILQEHKITRALFWLDAHGNETSYVDDGNNQVPRELEAITKYAPDSLVVIDDVTWAKAEPEHETKRWVNSSYELVIPPGWEATYVSRWAVLHRGGYELPETYDND
jgi:hypothetical protein